MGEFLPFLKSSAGMVHRRPRKGREVLASAVAHCAPEF